MTLIRRTWHNLPLASKIALFASMIIVLIILALTSLTIQRERESFRKELESQAYLLLDTLAERLRDPLINERIDEIDEIAEDFIDHEEITRFKVYNKNGVLKVDAYQPDKDIPSDTSPLNPMTFSQPAEIPGLYWQKDLIAEMSVSTQGGQVGFIQMGFSKAPLDQRIINLTVESSSVAAVALIFGVFLATLMARQTTTPIRELTRTANKMAAGDLSTRFRSGGKDEIGQLGRAFNDMANAIEKRETDLRNLAHSLEQTVEERTGELQQQNKYLAALHEITLGLIENLDIEALLEAIMTRAASLADTNHAFVSILDNGHSEVVLRVAQGGYRIHLGMRTKVDQGLAGQVMVSGRMAVEKDYQQYQDRHPDFTWLRTAIYVPLRSEAELLGVIGLGYDKVIEPNPNHVEILNQFAQLASLALINAQLYSAARQELSETEQALLAEEVRRRAYLASPQGRAESLAENILRDPDRALLALHDLTRMAEKDATVAVLPELPGIMETAGQPLLARIADGYQFIFRSQSEPELLAVGLRHLLSGLSLPEASSLSCGTEAYKIYNLCQQAAEVGNIHEVTELLPSLRSLEPPLDPSFPLSGLVEMLRALLPAAESLHSCERVTTTDDQRDYLASAIDCLSRADRVAQGLEPAEKPIGRRIVEVWIAVITLRMSDLQTRAQLSYHLLNQHSWKEEFIVVALRLRNEGRGGALNLRVKLERSADYDPMEETVLIDRLAPGEESQAEFRVRALLPAECSQFRARFAIWFDDPRGPDHEEHFADIVHLLAPQAEFQSIPNPYVAGTPLEAGSPLFYGREDIFNFISENLNPAHCNNLVLIGQRRTGKSSLLKQLPLRLGDRYLPVYLDGQSMVLDPGMPAFFCSMAVSICYAVQDRGFPFPTPDFDEFKARPAYTFEHDFLARVRQTVGDRHLVLLMDEFEELERAAKSGTLDSSVFGFLRHLVQHESRLSVIFCGTHRLEELAADYWSVLFNISLYKHVGFLEYAEALRLIQEPVSAYGMYYDDLALVKIWRITAGHPYFLQLLCHSLVNQHNRTKRSYVTVSDVNAALGEILASGEAHFVYLWNESSRMERLVLTALSRIIPLTGRVMSIQVEDYLSARGLSFGRQAILETLHHLTLRDILAAHVENQPSITNSTYSWRLGLLGLWIEKYKSLSLLQEEAA